jgi:dolichol-phosphate mannosyltransferase
MKHLSIVIPLYNESAGVGPLMEKVREVLTPLPEVQIEFILVDDGSTDATASVLEELAARDPRARVVSLLRNMGHQRAIMEGLLAARGEGILMMDGDGQHPPQVARKMISIWLEHPETDMVQGVRQSGQSAFKEKTASWFYRLVKLLIPELTLIPGAGDFRLITRRVRAVMLSRPECWRNIRVFLSQYRFVTVPLPYECEARLAGRSKYSLWKMIGLACNGVFAFTRFPLRLNLVIACLLMAFGLSFLLYTLFVKWLGGAVSGWPSLVGLICLLFSGVFAMLAVISEYIILIYEGMQARPSRPHEDVSEL